MKKQILTGIIALGTAVGAFAQGTVSFDNSNQSASPTPGDTHNGSIYVNGALLNQDINLALMGGNSSSNMSQIVALTFAAGTAQTDWSFNGTPGGFADPSGLTYAVPGVALSGTAFLEVEAWLGPDATYALAASHGFAVGISPIYQSGTGGGGVPVPALPVSIGDAMPSFNATVSPEPTTFALCGLGAASLLLFRRKK